MEEDRLDRKHRQSEDPLRREVSHFSACPAIVVDDAVCFDPVELPGFLDA
jgi:hypothetical protein